MIRALLALSLLAAPAAANPPPFVEGARITGVSVLRQSGVERRARLEPGPLDEAAVADVRARLLASGLFERVDVRLEKGSAPGRVRVVFDCVERNTASLDAIHLGHARPTKLWGGLEASDLDPFGVGLGLGGGFVTSEDQRAGRVSVDRSDVAPGLDLRLSARYLHGLEPFVGPVGQRLGQRPVDEVRVPYRRAGADLAGRLAVGPASLLFGVRGEWVRATLPDGAEQLDPDGAWRPFRFHAPAGDSAHGVLSLGVEYDVRDDPAHPSRGTRAAFVARGGLGAGAFAGALLDFEHSLRLFFGHVLRLDAKTGALVGDPPFFERFFIGDLHPWIPAPALGLNFARRRGPNLVDGTIVEQRYETFAGRAGLEYRIPLARSGPDDPYGVELFFGGAFLALGSPGELGDADLEDRDPFPFDVAVDFGLRIDSEIGVMGVSVGNLFYLVDP